MTLYFVFKVLNGLDPYYLVELLPHHTPVRALRSTNQLLLDVLRSMYKNRGDQAFAVAAHNLWNSLSILKRIDQTLETFMLLLKTNILLAFNLS